MRKCVQCLISIVVLLLCLGIPSLKGQSSLWRIEIAPNLTIPAGKVNHKFWNYPEDSNITSQQITVKEEPQTGLVIVPGFKRTFRSKKAVSATFALGLGYYLTRYKMSWLSNYQSTAGPGIIHIVSQVTRQELGLNLLPGINYKKLNVEFGFNLKFTIRNRVKRQLLRNGVFYMNTDWNDPDELRLSRWSCSFPVIVSYTIPLAPKLWLQPFLAYEFGFMDWDLYGFGNVNRSAFVFMNQLQLGVTLSMPTKK